MKDAFPPVKTKEIVAWAGFDFANSSFGMTVTTLAFPLFLAGTIMHGQSEKDTDLMWSVAASLSGSMVVVLSPFLGAWADVTARKKLFLFGTYITCVVFTLLMTLLAPGDTIWAVLVFAIANAAYGLSENFASAFLPELSTPRTIGWISAIGWGIGYLGAFTILLLCVPFLKAGFGPDNIFNIQMVFLITAVFFAIGGFPAFLILRERAVPQPRAGGNLFVSSWIRVLQTCWKLRHDRTLAIFFIGFLCYMSGILAVTTFFSLFAKQVIGFDASGLVLLLLIIQVSAAVGAFIFGAIEDKLGHKRVVQISLSVWIMAVVAAYFVTSKEYFLLVANFAGLALGGCQSASRVIVGLLSPPERRAEYYGLWGLLGKLAAVIGPAAFGGVRWLTDSPRWSIVSAAAFFVAGIILIQMLPRLRPSEPTRSQSHE
jgi:UMF1 family MFS transporter